MMDDSDYGHLVREVEQLHEENTRLREALGQISQIIHGNTRVTSRIAEAALKGADLRDIDTVEQVASGEWKPPQSATDKEKA